MCRGRLGIGGFGFLLRALGFFSAESDFFSAVLSVAFFPSVVSAGFSLGVVSFWRLDRSEVGGVPAAALSWKPAAGSAWKGRWPHAVQTVKRDVGQLLHDVRAVPADEHL